MRLARLLTRAENVEKGCSRRQEVPRSHLLFMTCVASFLRCRLKRRRATSTSPTSWSTEPSSARRSSKLRPHPHRALLRRCEKTLLFLFIITDSSLLLFLTQRLQSVPSTSDDVLLCCRKPRGHEPVSYVSIPATLLTHSPTDFHFRPLRV